MALGFPSWNTILSSSTGPSLHVGRERGLVSGLQGRVQVLVMKRRGEYFAIGQNKTKGQKGGKNSLRLLAYLAQGAQTPYGRPVKKGRPPKMTDEQILHCAPGTPVWGTLGTPIFDDSIELLANQNCAIPVG